MPAQKLTPEQQRYVVTRLACFERPMQITFDLEEEGTHINVNSLRHYDPTTFMGQTLSEGLKKLFYETRAKYLEDASKLDISSAAYRLAQLQRLAERAEFHNDVRGALAAYAQAAREVERLLQTAPARHAPAESPASGPDGYPMGAGDWMALLRERTAPAGANGQADRKG